MDQPNVSRGSPLPLSRGRWLGNTVAEGQSNENQNEELRQIPKKTSTLLRVCPYILGNEFCERLAYYGLTINFVNYLTKVMGLSESESAMQVMLFSGTAYLTPLLGAYLADARWGRYRTILVFSAIYCLGMAAMAAQAGVPGLHPPRGEPSTSAQLGVLYTALYIIALGTGGIKPNVSAFGADQFDEHDPQDAKDKKSFFMWFYFTVNCGSLIGTTAVVYVQEQVSWAIGYAVPAIALLVAICSFLIGSPKYRHVRPAGSPFVRIFQVLQAAYLNRGERGPADSEAALREPLISAAADGQGEKLHHSESLFWLDKAAAAAAPPTATPHRGPGDGRPRFSQKQVEEVKLVLRMLPVFFTTVTYSTVYAQFNSFFIVQGEKMDRVFFGRRIPAASMTLFDTIAIIALVPAYEHALMPLLRRLRRQPTLLQRIGWGMVVSICAMLAAAAVERARIDAVRSGDALLTAAWQIPQYLLVGASEVLCMVGQLEFFYDQAPDVMRSMGMALQMLSISLGSYLSGALTALVRSATAGPGGQGGWLPKDLNEGRLDLFFLLLAGLMFANLLAFLWVASGYIYKHVPHKTYQAPSESAGQAPPAEPEEQDGVHPHSEALPIAARRGPRPLGWRQDDSQDVPSGSQRSTASTDPYSRSITVVPQSMVLPGPMR
mmetsp:Transcript_33294/g.78958  ORF Transcript_33294/g.78958 Transcript_33294/m.78958 type:complete len:662 (+) Transcript_33294:161-2146(+)